MRKGLSIIMLVVLLSFVTAGSAAADELTRPTLYVASYTVDGDLSAGEDIVIHFTLRNASQQAEVSNILMDVQSPAGAFFPSPGTTSQYFISSIPAGESHTEAVYMTVLDTVSDNTYNIVYSLSWHGAQSEVMFSNSGIISLSVKSGSLEIVEVSVPEESPQGRLEYISVRYVNMSESERRGAMIRIDGNIEEYQKVIDIGTVRPSSSGIAETNVIFTQSGNQRLVFDLIYEADGGAEVVSDSFTAFTLVIAEPGNGISVQPPSAPGDQQNQPSTTNGPTRGNTVLMVAVIAVLCAGAIVIAVIWKKHR